MTGDELRALRLELGLSLVEMARALGFKGNDRNERRRMRGYEDMRDWTLPPDLPGRVSRAIATAGRMSPELKQAVKRANRDREQYEERTGYRVKADAKFAAKIMAKYGSMTRR